MNDLQSKTDKPKIAVERLEKLNRADLQDLCEATVAAIEKDGGFGWVSIPERDVMQRYWQGVMAVPQRDLFVGRLDGAIAGTAQLVRNPLNNQAQSLFAQLTTVFVAPWARGYGIGQILLQRVEDYAREIGLHVINLDVRETQLHAIGLFKQAGYTQWGMNPTYALVDGRVIPGYFMHKEIRSLPVKQPIET